MCFIGQDRASSSPTPHPLPPAAIVFGFAKNHRANIFSVLSPVDGDGNRNLSLGKYPNKIKPYLMNIIIDLQNSDTRKIQLTIAINFFSSKDAKEEHVMHSSSGNTIFTSYNDANDVIDELFECFQYTVNLALNYEEADSHPKRFSNIKQFISKYDWKEIKYPSKTDDGKTIQKNDPTIALNILYIKEKEICSAYISEINLNFEKQIILLMILNKEKEG